MTAKLGAAGTGAKFSPLEVGWANAYWPAGPAFRSEGYPDGQVMNDGEPIPDEAGSYDLEAVADSQRLRLHMLTVQTLILNQPLERPTQPGIIPRTHG